MKKEVLCLTCICWVDCGEKDGSPHGFCLACDLFTYKAETRCADYIKGEPIPVEEFDNAI